MKLIRTVADLLTAIRRRPEPCNVADGYVLSKADPGDLTCPHQADQIVVTVCPGHGRGVIHTCTHHVTTWQARLDAGDVDCDICAQDGVHVHLRYEHTEPAHEGATS